MAKFKDMSKEHHKAFSRSGDDNATRAPQPANTSGGKDDKVNWSPAGGTHKGCKTER